MAGKMLVLDENGNITESAGGGGGSAFYDRRNYTGVAGTATFAVNYTAPYVEVLLNGVLLDPADYTATSGASVTLATPVADNADVVTVIGLTSFDVADTISDAPADGGTYVRKDSAWAEITGGEALLSVKWWPSRVIPAGFVAADGQVLNRATYPDAWAAIDAGGAPLANESGWQANPLYRGHYSRGDGSTTFRVPDYNGAQPGSLGAVFLRGDGALSAGTPGLIQQDAFQNHKHYLGASGGTDDAAVTTMGTGPTLNGRAANFSTTVANSPVLQTTAPVTDGTNGTPRTAGETRPLNVTGCWIVKLFGAVTNVGAANAAQLASDYANLNGAFQTLDGEIDFTIIYPNGGSQAGPASVVPASRYVEANPFPGHRVLCQAELWIDDEWCVVEFDGYATNNSAGVSAAQHNDRDIVVQTGQNYLLYTSNNSFFTGATRSTITGARPCRVKVWKVKGAWA